jgi:valyl-tRNA synthetase
VLLDVLAELLRLLHPLLPFVTEEIWGKLPEAIHAPGELLITQRYPSGSETGADTEKLEKIEADFTFLQELTRSIRTLRSECTIAPEKKLRALVRSDRADIAASNDALICLLAGLSGITAVSASDQSAAPDGAVASAGAGFEAFLFIAEVVDMDILKAKWARELEKDKKFIAGLKSKLGNENFLKNAPADLAEAERVKLAEAENHAKKLEAYLR